MNEKLINGLYDYARQNGYKKDLQGFLNSVKTNTNFTKH
jgi:hypothetical protein